MMRVRWRTVVVVAPLVLTLIAVACQVPTQVLIEVRTDVAYRPGIVTSFTVGATPADVETSELTTESSEPWGADGRIGTLATVPRSSAEDGRISVKIVMGIRRAARECKPPLYEGCIVARRALYYVPNELLRLPISLYANCEGVPCDQASTCNALGQCVSSEVDLRSCTELGNCALIADQSPDGAAPLPDASFPPLEDGGMSKPDADASYEDAMSPVDASDASGEDASDASDASGGDASDASDASGRDASDASDDGSDSGSSPGPSSKQIDCPGATNNTCDKLAGAGQKCCYSVATMTGECIAATATCSAHEIQCDDNTDCPDGESCCVSTDERFVCVAGGCTQNYRPVCHVTQTCIASMCSQFYGVGAYYRACATNLSPSL